MRQIFLFLSVLLLGLTWSAAQNTTPSTSSPTSSGQTPHTSAAAGQTSTSSGAEKSVEGCLSGSGGTYTLTDKNGMTYQLTGDTAKLSEHVGHEVKIMGTPSSEGASTGAETGGGASGNAASQTLQVTSVKHISKTCKSGTGMSH